MGGCLRATAALITSVAWVASSALQRIHLSCCNTSAPLFPQYAKEKPQPRVSTPLCLLGRFVKGTLSVRNTRQHPQNVWKSQRRAVWSSSPLRALPFTHTFSVALEMNSSPAQNRGTRRVQRLKFNTDRGDKKPTYRRKIKINPSESAGGFSLGAVVAISPSVSVCVCFFSYYGERIVVGNPFLPIRELLSPPCVQMMTMATKSSRKNDEHHFRLVLSE